MHAPLPSTFEPADTVEPSDAPTDATVDQAADRMADSRIGALLQQAGKLTADGVERVMRAQQESGVRFGVAAARLGLVDQEDIDAAVAGQFACPIAAGADSPLSPRLAVAFHPASAQSDTLRAIRSQLLLRWFSLGRHALAISGAGPGDASSVLAANLALVFAQLGQRTLLVDANLRHGIQHTLFGLQAEPGPSMSSLASPDPAWSDAVGSAVSAADAPMPGLSRPGLSRPGLSWPGLSWPGLSDVLAGRAGLEAIIQVPGFPALSLLPSGTIPPNPQELLARASFAALHGQLGDAYDVVLYDIAPTSHGAEALAVAMHAGAALLVAQKNRTPVAALQRLAQQMAAASVAVVGSVLVEA